MKKFLASCIGLLAFWGVPTLAHAQNNGSEKLVSAAQQLIEEIGLDHLPASITALKPADARNLSALKQTGSNNEATIEQINIGSLPNQSLIVQAGIGNIVGLYQSGFDNTSTLKLKGDKNIGKIAQDGSSNSFDGQITGHDNTFDVVQTGSGNHSTLDVVSNGRDYPVLQQGNNNSLVQREGPASTAPLGYGVEMRGNGIRLTIEQGRAHP
jgi:minor curlin subunit